MKNYMKEIVNDFFSDNEEEEPKAYLILGKKSDYRSMDISNKSTDAMMSSVNLLYDKVDKNSIDWGALVANSANIELRGLDETMEDEKSNIALTYDGSSREIIVNKLDEEKEDKIYSGEDIAVMPLQRF